MTSDSNPEKSIGFLLDDVSRLLRRDFNRRVRCLGLTQAQWRAIAYLAREEGIKQATLAERLEVMPITVGRLIDRLQGAGWVMRQADLEDRRLSLLFLTDKAQPILNELRAHANDALDVVMAGVSRSERQQLVKSLERMRENLSCVKTAEVPSSKAGTKKDAGKQHKAKHRRLR